MSAEQLIAELQNRGLIADRLALRLREKVAESNRPLSARTLANFLVQKNHLSQAEADNLLSAASASGIDIDADAPPEAPTQISSAAFAGGNNMDPDEDYEGSSIFAPFLSSADKNKVAAPEPEDDNELTLVSIEEDMVADAPRPAASEVLTNDSVSSLAGFLSTESPSSRQMTAPPIAEEDKQPVVTVRASTPVALTNADLIDSELKKDGAPKGKAIKRKAKPALRKKEWDSPLILYGGGGLALMVLLGAAVVWILNWEKGDQELAQARQALESGAYPQAIEHYEKFLVDSPRHAEVSTARVQLAMARIRQATESSNYSAALEIAQKELDAIEDEKEFKKSQPELTALLPQIALGLARQAEKAGAGAEDTNQLVEHANTALELCNNLAYIPQQMRDEGQLNVVRELLARVQHREISHQALQEALAAMQKAIDGSDASASYTAHKTLVKRYPELAGDAKLAEMIQKTTAAEQSAIRFVSEEQAAETAERPTPWVASLALAQRHGNPPAAAATAPTNVACVRVDGAVYGLDAATGQLLWRRHVGYASAAWPILIDGHVLVSDARQHDLLRLDAATGKLVWRQTIGKPFAAPLVVGPRAFVSAESGKLYVIDLATGARSGYLQFAQPLGVPPTADRRQERLYLTGKHFSLYSLSLAELKCLGVYYLGHDAGSIQFAPAQVLNKLAVVENDGVETSRLHLLSIGENGAVTGEETSKRLQGLAASPLMVEGRRLIVVTDRGRFDVYEVGSGQGDAALAQLATREATDRQPIVRYVAVADGHIWVGDTQLTKYAILPTGDRLPVVSIDNNFAGAAFDHPLEVFGDTVVHIRRPRGRAGWVVAATDAKQGRTLWETDLAVPPAWSPIVDESGRALVVANANGYVFRFDEAAIRSRIQDQPLVTRSMPSPLSPLTSGTGLGRGRAAYFAPGSDELLLYDPAARDGAVQWIKLESPLACAATPFGDGLLAPLKIGQVFYMNPADGKSLAAPFQPRLQPRSTVAYQPAGAADRRFVITDSHENIYLVGLEDQPQPHLNGLAKAKIGPYRIMSPVAVLGDLAAAAAEGAHLVRFKLPALEAAGELDLPGEVVWGPFRVGDQLVLATADEMLVGISPAGDVAWSEPLQHGDLAGPPLAVDSGFLLAYRKGILERRNLADGKPAGECNLEHPIAAGPVKFLSRIVLAAGDGTLLVVDQP